MLTLTFILAWLGQPTPPANGKTSTLTKSLSLRDNEIVLTAEGEPCVTPLTKNSKLLETLPVAVKRKLSPAQAVLAGLSLIKVAVGAGPALTVTVTKLLSVVHCTPLTVLMAKRLNPVVVNIGDPKT